MSVSQRLNLDNADLFQKKNMKTTSKGYLEISFPSSNFEPNN